MQNSWQEMYNELRKFREENGHCLVNVNTSKLGRWVERMRKERKRGLLREDKVRRLSELGFVWQRRTKSANCIDFATAYLSPQRLGRRSLKN